MINNKINILNQQEINTVTGAANVQDITRPTPSFTHLKPGESIKVESWGGSNGIFTQAQLQPKITLNKHVDILPYIKVDNINGKTEFNCAGAKLRFNFDI